MPRRNRAVLAALIACAMLPSPAEAGDVDAGRAFAERTCAECHAIFRDGRPSPNLRAPPFTRIADTPGMTATALAIFLRTPHPTMPNIVIADADLADVVAYVLTLRAPR